MRSAYAAPLLLARESLITEDQAARVHNLAKRILREVGLEVRCDPAVERLRAAGCSVRGDRVLFESGVVDEHVEEMRRWIASQPAPTSALDDAVWAAMRSPVVLAPREGRLTLCVGTGASYVHDIDLDRVVPYTTDRLIQMCKLVDTLAGADVCGAPPGVPTDVHPDLQSVVQYRIAAFNARLGAHLVLPNSIKTAGHLLDMAEVMGRPIQSLPVFLASPLRLGGELLDVALASRDRLSYIWVGSMPCAGSTAPVHPFGAMALAAAELIAGRIVVSVLTDKPVIFRVGVFPFDQRACTLVFGSPENLLYQMLCGDLNHYYGWPQSLPPHNIHVMSKLPDGQSAAEKAMIMALGASLGARYFECAGTLGLDEVFSPEQLLLDCEIRDWVQRAVQGLELEEEGVDNWLAEIKSGLDQGFISLDSTLDHYQRGQTWYPRRFEREVTGPWLAQDQPRLAGRLRDEVRQRIAAHDFELDTGRRNEIERIYLAAQQAVEG